MRVLTLASLVLAACGGAPARPAVSSSPKPVEAQASSPVERAKLATAENGLPLLGGDAPTVVVTGDDVYCDGEKVGDARAIVRLQRVDELFKALKRRGPSAKREVLLAFDASTASVVLK